MGIFGENLFGNLLGVFGALSISFLAGAWIGDEYGFSARKLASAQSQLDATNKALKSLQDSDAEMAAREDAEDKARMSDFSKAAVQKLPVNKDTAAALNKLTDGG